MRTRYSKCLQLVGILMIVSTLSGCPFLFFGGDPIPKEEGPLDGDWVNCDWSWTIENGQLLWTVNCDTRSQGVQCPAGALEGPIVLDDSQTPAQIDFVVQSQTGFFAEPENQMGIVKGGTLRGIYALSGSTSGTAQNGLPDILTVEFATNVENPRPLEFSDSPIVLEAPSIFDAAGCG